MAQAAESFAKYNGVSKAAENAASSFSYILGIDTFDDPQDLSVDYAYELMEHAGTMT